MVMDDNDQESNRAVYKPNTEMLNHSISAWHAQGIRFCGIFHSHPPGQRTLSHGDLAYIRTIMDAMPDGVDQLYFPIVIPGEGIYPFVAERTESGLQIRKDEMELIEGR